MLLGSEGAGLTRFPKQPSLLGYRRFVRGFPEQKVVTCKVLWEIMLGGTSFLPPLEALVAAATLEMIMYVL